MCLTIAINEFLVWLRRSKRAGDLAFSLMCLGGAFFCFSCAGEYSVDTSIQSIPWLKAQVVFLSLAGFALFWYIAEVTRLVRKQYLWAFLAWNMLVVLSQAIDLGDLAWIASRPTMLDVRLPLGLHMVYKEVDSGIVTDAINLVAFGFLAYLAFVVAAFWRRGNRRESSVMLAVLGLVLAAEANDFLVGMGLYTSIYLMEYAWLAVILVMGLRRSNEIKEAIQTRRALRKSDRDLEESQTMLAAVIDSTSDLIWSVDSDSFGLLAYNRGLRDYVARRYGKDVEVGMRSEELFPAEAEIEFWNGSYARARDEGAYSIEHRAFVDSGIFQLSVNRLERGGELFGLSVFAKDITERKKADDQIRRALSEKETLLRELYHRTKNNMNVIISMLKLQAREVGDERLKRAYAETEDRIISMSLVHEKLYEAQDLSHINLREYFEDLTRQLLANYSVPGRPPALSLDMDDVFVAIDTAISCGLIVNELISNSLKYAFPSGRNGEIKIKLRQGGEGEVELAVSDDGVGLPPGFDSKRDGHLGLRLIENLARGRIRAQLEIGTDHGLSCSLKFKESK